MSASRIYEIRRGEASLSAKRDANRQWYIANKHRVLEASRLAREDNPDKFRQAVRRSRAKNPEASREATRAWFKAHPAEAHALLAKRRALKRQATIGDPKAIAAVYERARSAEVIPCAYCGRDTEPSEWHVDHRVPLCRGGAHSADNLRVCCAACNLAKGKLTAAEFLRGRSAQ